ncbi:MAG: HK97 family phage prohead protease [Clostridia bacterium]|nr:HK97 family phage prohead protease [Clostridia bacterium]MBQ1555231.1 HK97 family phage prohead protease [Clostridia bacterium]
MKKYDFSGWATRNNLRCSDGRTICKDAFKANDGQTVPLVWNHQHNEPFNVLGHALLENRSDGVYAYCTFNDTESGRAAKQLVEHGDVSALSIYANQLRQQGSNVLHGMIREVSLVLAGANPGAFIESVLSHGEESDEEAVIYTGETILMHSDEQEEETDMNENPKKKGKPEDEETVADVFNTLTEKQKTVVYALIGQALEDQNGGDDDDEEEGNRMKHNVFDMDTEPTGSYLSHADEESIINMAKATNVGSFQTAMQIFADENGLELQHDAVSSGFARSGDGNIYNLFPEYKEVRPGAPELITNDQGWVKTVMNKVHKSPISRIRTSQVDIRNIDTLRAKGYQTGKQKTQMGNFTLVRRTTDPQTVYVKNALHRDDIVDITDFDYVDYLYNINRAMLDEELATAIMLGDGRSDESADKIAPEHIRPIWLDDELYTIHRDLDMSTVTSEIQGVNSTATFGSNYLTAEAMVNTVLYARETYKGSGTPDMYITPHMLNVMLLARDINGRRIYSSKAELASSLNVGEIYTAEQFVNKTRTTSNNKTKKLLALIVNLADYSLGATKGGEVTHFTQFDIDFNQEKSLLETRVSGALTRVYSAIAIEEDVTPAPSNG